ncbi:glycoside hydrolase superfamily, partial [Rhodotorula diobovata]
GGSSAAGGGQVAYGRGGDGDEVTLEDGERVVYRNAFGGTFDADPHSLSAQAQDDSPPLSEEWDYERLRIRGVNLGGWLTLEPFITPHLFEPYLDAPSPAVDEYTLSANLRDDVRLESTMREHYDSFITERDLIAIAAAGLNWIRLPVPYWAVATWDDEPFLEKVAWEYVLKAVVWARKYGIRINLDLHSVPGSQNGWNHSGRLGSISFLRSSMGQANAQRALDYVAALAEFTSRKGVREVVPMYSVLNEPMLAELGEPVLRGFYRVAYETVRNITGYGPNRGPLLAFADGFKGTRRWYNFLETPAPKKAHAKHALDGLDRVAWDSHRYLAFAEPDLRSVREQVLKPCQRWGAEFNKTMINAGVAVSGEFSLGVNDCGRFLNNVFQGTRLEGTFPNETSPAYPPSAPQGACEFWEDYKQWDDEMRSALRDLALAQMDTFQNWFYWTWRTLPSTIHLPHITANALWSYSLGLKQGWIPADPRVALADGGFCAAYAAKVGGDADGGGGRRYKLDDVELEPWKVGRPNSTYSGRVPPGAAQSMRAPYPAREFDTPPRGYNGGGMPVAGLWAYAREGDAPVLESPAGAEGPTERARERKWASRRSGCSYPGTWGAPDELDAVGDVPVECSVAAALERGEL